jgi:hypothetical protein
LECAFLLLKSKRMPAETYTDLFVAKDRVSRILRETGAQSYSRLLMDSQLPEGVLGKVLELLEKENKIRVKRVSPQAETTYQPASGAWGLSGLGV